ncbi:MAG: hypothetical protein ACO1PN_03425 [Betaproteobacteria bacterium]
MSTLDALLYLWGLKAAISFALLPAVFVALCATPEYVRHPQIRRMWFLKRIFYFAVFLVVFPCLIPAFSSRPFWDALLIPLDSGKGLGAFIWGLVLLCVTTIFAFAELAARERSTRMKQNAKSDNSATASRQQEIS